MSKDKTPNNMGDFDAINEVVDEVTAENSLHNEGRIIQVELDHEMRKSFLEYSMSVIVDRALPDVRDGLKPVHRRILFAADEDGLTPDKPHRKSATIVGDVLGRYHPHGDASVYDAMVRLAQTFSLRYPLIDGHGNFGTIDGDPPAAYRYTEARLSKIALYMLSDIDKDTVDWNPNFDDQRKEPVVLPSRFPNLLCNGSVGIAVGMATNIPPHNLREVSDAVCYLIDHPEAELNELMQYIQGPDFPTGGIIMGRSGIRAAYATGRGKITLRSKTEIEEMKNGRERIIVREIPYMVNKTRLIESIAQLVKDKRVDGISYINDESDREGMRIVIDLKMGANAQVVLNQLYSFTQLQDSIGVIMLALENGVPKVMTLKEMLEELGPDGDWKTAIEERMTDLIPNHITVEDIMASINYLNCVAMGIGTPDDIDHLGNRRLRCVGELLQNQFRIGFSRMERVIRERMTVQDLDSVTPWPS